MIHSYSKIKTDGILNEDFKTYTTIGILQYLPVDMFWNLIKNSVINHDRLPSFVGEIENIEFWPKWYKLQNIDKVNNTKYIEPDIFIRFKMYDCIIEVKKSDSHGQYKEQWLSQTQAYHNEYSSNKKLIYIALGGNINLDELSDLSYVYKATWQKLLQNVHLALQERNIIKFPTHQIKQEIRILSSVIEIFSQYNEYMVELMDTIQYEKIFLIPNQEINQLWKI